MLLSQFARKKGSKDKKKRTRSHTLAGHVTKGARIGAGVGAGHGAIGHAMGKRKNVSTVKEKLRKRFGR